MAESDYSSAQQQQQQPQQDGNKQSFKQNFDNFKKFASTNFTRARQYATEKIGKAESVTELDSDIETLFEQLDSIKAATEKLLGNVRVLMLPDPSARFEEWALMKLDRPKPERFNVFFSLNIELARAGTAFGSDTQYGAYLLHCAEIEGKIGAATKRFHEKIHSEFIIPLKAFLEVDVKQAMRERKALNTKRLDLDAAKNKANRTSADKLQNAETELHVVQADFDMQLEHVRSQIRKIVDTHVSHMGHLRSFMAAQRTYFAECQALLGDLQGPGPKAGVSSGSSSITSSATGRKTERPTGKVIIDGIELDREEQRKARLLYDYEAEDDSGLNFSADDVITVLPIPDEEDYMMAETDGKFGRIPSTYVALL